VLFDLRGAWEVHSFLFILLKLAKFLTISCVTLLVSVVLC